MVSYYVPLSHCTADRRFNIRVIANNQSRSMWALDSARVHFVASSFHCLHELDRQMQPS